MTLASPFLPGALGAAAADSHSALDSGLPTVEFSVASQSGAEAGASLTVTLRLSVASASDVTVPFAVTGSALPGVDFNVDASPTTIPAGSRTHDLTITLLDDLLHEDDETAVLTIGTPTGADLGTILEHTATILNDDVTPTVEFTAVSQSAGEGAGTATINVQLSAVSGLDVIAPFSVAGSALEGVDYNLSATQFSIPAGSLTAALTVTITPDDLYEADETVELALGAPTGASLGTQTNHTLTLNDDDAVPTVEFNFAESSANEADGSVLVSISLSAVSALDVHVPFSLSGTAAQGLDFSLGASEFMIPAGSVGADLDVFLIDETDYEADETVVVTLGSPTGADLGFQTVHTLTILNDDGAPTVDLTAASQSVSEAAGSATVSVQLSALSSFEVRVPFTLAGSALEGVDFGIIESEFVVTPGNTSGSVTVSLTDDLLHELDETMELTLGTSTGAQLGSTTVHVLTIIDDDVAPIVEFSLATQSLPEDGGPAQVSVLLSSPAGRPVIVPFLLSGTATSGSDFTLLETEFIIPEGLGSAQLSVALLEEGLDEDDETLVITLGTPDGATLGALGVHELTIEDVDATPTLSFVIVRSQMHEGDGQVPIELRMSEASGREVSVDFVTYGSANDPTDYTLNVSPIEVDAGDTSVYFLVDLVDDFVTENIETLVIELTNFTDVLEGDISMHLAMIIDDDGITTGIVVQSLVMTPSALEFDLTQVGSSSPSEQVIISNPDSIPLTFQGVVVLGPQRDDWVASYSSPPPVLLMPDQSITVDLTFVPQDTGPRAATLRVRQAPHGIPVRTLALSGMAYGPTGNELPLTIHEGGYTDSTGLSWITDFNYSGSTEIIYSLNEILDTDEDVLYQIARTGQDFSYQFPIPNGTYDVDLHFAEIDKEVVAEGQRVFDVTIEDVVTLDDLDIYYIRGQDRAFAYPLRTVVSDGVLDLRFQASAGDALVCAIKVRSVPLVTAAEGDLDFGAVSIGSSPVTELPLTLVNTGLHGAIAGQLVFIGPGYEDGAGQDFYVVLDGTEYRGAEGTISYPINLVIDPGEQALLVVGFEPTVEVLTNLTLRFEGNFDTVDIAVAGHGALGDWGYLHPVISTNPILIIDYDGDLAEDVALDATASHTHETSQSIVGFEWREGGVPFSTSATHTRSFPLGSTNIDLTISDDAGPVKTALEVATIKVYAATAVPGILSTYYDAVGVGATVLIHNPLVPAHRERLQTLSLPAGATVGCSTLSADAVVVWQADFVVDVSANYDFTTSGGLATLIFVDGLPVSNPLAAGSHTLEARFAVDTLADLPLELTLQVNGVDQPLFADALTHDETLLKPLIHDMPTVGAETGGNLITIQGFGFFPQSLVKVHWGQLAGSPDITSFEPYGDGKLEFLSPPSPGPPGQVIVIYVTVETPNGISNSASFTYSPDGDVPINWTFKTVQIEPSTFRPTTGEWGPDGRFYVGTVTGNLLAMTFDVAYNVTLVDTYPGVSGLQNSQILGLTFSPFDDSSPVKIYVAHSEIYAQGGGTLTSPYPYPGQVSVLTGPNFDTPVPLITGLPTSNHDHAINGLEFDNQGDLWICVGGNTNAGVVHEMMGALPESPLAGAILRAETSRPDFNGAIHYIETATGLPNDDQVFGDIVDVAPGSHVTVYASGLRNPYDLALTVSGHLYATDNGPNEDFGAASTGPDTDTGLPGPTTPDEILFVQRDNYYGHPNRNRGRQDPRQNIYYDVVVPSIPEWFTQLIYSRPSSIDGIAEYRANTFNGQLRGSLLAQKFNYRVHNIELAPDGRSVTAHGDFTPNIFGLDVATAPGGVILGTDYYAKKLNILVPNDSSAIGLTVSDIFPWRAPETGGTPFMIAGTGFGSLTNTTVQIGGIATTISSLGPHRIRGVIPAGLQVGELYDVVVKVGLDTKVLSSAFLCLPATPGFFPGMWESGTPLPMALGEVAGGIIDGKLYLMGEGNPPTSTTYTYDLAFGFWTDTAAQRTFAGHHHAAEVLDGKLYLLGGLGGSEGQVQIFDPNQGPVGTWTLGSSMPWAGGACTSVVIEGLIYVAGGITGASTVANVAVYDPVADSWTSLAPMATKVNHAAAATDGSRMFVFGGRQGPNVPQPGFKVIQVYDPVSGLWDSSSMPGTQLTEMPSGRGGTGRAVFYQGDFYVFGGETNDASDPEIDPGRVFAQVFVYDPVSNTWHQDARMPTAVHGMFPLLFENRIHLIGGGTTYGFSQSTLHQIFSRL